MNKVFDNIEKCKSKYKVIWESMDTDKSLLKHVSRQDKNKTKKQINLSINSLIDELNKIPKEQKNNIDWRNDLKQILKQRSKMMLNINNKEFEEIMINEFTDTTEQFIDSAKEFDESCTLDDISQAMRNVWIMNMIQVIANIKIEHTPSIFAYSMLYPCTDNFLDDPNITYEEKKLFNQRLGKRLDGQMVETKNKNEQKIYDLVAQIEKQYPRDAFPQVFDSIKSIHIGQIKSLNQQDILASDDKEKILDISIEKGSASVIADAYLVCGDLEDELFDLMFGFGFLLQLIDDLQDAAEDFANNHSTIFSLELKKGRLDAMTDKLITFSLKVLDFESYKKSPYIQDIKQLITNNMLMLIFEAIWNNKKFFSREYIKTFKKVTPVDFKFVNRKMKKVKIKLEQVKEYF